MEIWKDVKGFEGLYCVSNTGRIKAIVYLNNKKNKKNNGAELNRLLKPINQSKGYLSIGLSKGGIVFIFLIHRIVATHFILNPEKKPQVNHVNGIKTDNRIENLEWCTAKENIEHAHQNNLMPIPEIGENRPNCKITTNTAFNIKKLYSMGFKRSFICKYLSVSVYTAKEVISGKRYWKHIKL